MRGKYHGKDSIHNRNVIDIPHELIRSFTSMCCRDSRIGDKVGQIGPKWDKSMTFSDQISVHLAGPQIGQIRDFFRSDFSTFGSMSQMY